ncbi:uncharacterized protein A1O9_02066 [Exophiala aquamarina CBS 119918]|uniref:Zn(2)-C6 fungal-type domain-containing protein n=1 Tax=Exophiala aquamarina CBS 119918 TaxID=1182545 RepID=A0A072PY17_9EURO|nr:uncharacterized protein A1O9_02066 [Exophiala aquamarina CBS 119918]KEF60505.1 hypothetical protein A1O9_02066 [Exophiala aquamarina CBS 119918]
MLQTCTRCRSRRIKCDTRLPACQNCAKNDSQCVFLDEALQEQIPRSYVRALNDKISELTSQLDLQKGYAARYSIQDATVMTAAAASNEDSYVLMPRTQRYLHLERSLPTIVTRLTVEALSGSSTQSDMKMSHDAQPFSTDIFKTDRSALTPKVVRHLLSRYDRCVRPEFDIVDPELLSQDGQGLKKLSKRQKFETLMICAVAAGHESYRNPSWKALAQTLRDWAAEDTASVISAADPASLTAILLLIVYELLEPSRGSVWELMDMAIRTTIQLGWHRRDRSEVQIDLPEAGSHSNKDGYATQQRLLHALKTADRALSLVFNQSSTPNDWLWTPNTEEDFLLRLYRDVQGSIYGYGQLYDTHSCPFVGHVEELIMSMETFSLEQSPTVCEMWLQLLPVSVRHRQCVSCFQEEGDVAARGMRSLRRRLVAAALALVEHTHCMTISPDGFIPPLTASARALVAGCTVLLARAKNWSPESPFLKAILQCTEVLTHFTSHWKGGSGYLRVWTIITEIFDKNQPKSQ